MATVTVIGGGVSGLACARRILDLAPRTTVRLMEASSRVGGTVATDRHGDWVVEAGPNAFLNKHKAVMDLVLSLKLDSELVTANEKSRKRYVFVDRKLRHFPDSFQALLTSDLLSVRGRARLLLEPALPPRHDTSDESVASFARRRLGREGAGRLLDPVVAGIYAGDPERLSMGAALPQLAAAERAGASISKLLIDSRRGRPDREDEGGPAGVGRRRLVSFQSGMGRLIERLSETLVGSIEIESPVRKIRRTRSGWQVEPVHGLPFHSDVLVLAVPPPAVTRIAGHLHPELKEAVDHVPSAPVAVVGLGFRESAVPHPLDGFGHLVPTIEPGRVLGVMWSTSMFPGIRSPRGRVLLRVFLGGTRSPGVCEQSDDQLVLEARKHVGDSLGITAAPVHIRLFRHAVGIPQYQVGHPGRAARAAAALTDLPGLFIVGHSLFGVGIASCVDKALSAGAAVAEYVDVLQRLPAGQGSFATTPASDARVSTA